MKTMIHSNEAARALLCPHKALLFARQKNSEEAPDFALPDRSECKRRYSAMFEALELPCGHTGDDVTVSFDLLSQARGGLDLRFKSRGIRTTIPLLLFDEENSTDRPKWKVYYPIYGPAAKVNMLDRLYVDTAILYSCGIELSSISMIVLRPDLISDPALPDQDIFMLQSALKKARGGYLKQSVLESVEALNRKMPYSKFLDLAASVFEQEDIVPRKVRACTSPSKCPLYESCWKESDKKDDDPSMLFSCANKEEFERRNIHSLAEIPGDLIDGQPLQYAQIQAARHESGRFMDLYGLRHWMDQLEWPLCYLDFEWDTFVLSPYTGMKPFEVLCFQYSLHIEEKDGSIEHTAFFETGDCRVDFIESLLADMPETGSIVVFNMEGAERLRLLHLADQFPQYRKKLEALCDRMIDLATPFESGCYYDLRQRGHSSLKTLLPLFTDDASYDSLAVHNGVQAVLAYRQAKNETAAVQLQTARAISEYCSMDTLAEKKLYDGLRQTLSNACKKKASNL